MAYLQLVCWRGWTKNAIATGVFYPCGAPAAVQNAWSHFTRAVPALAPMGPHCVRSKSFQTILCRTRGLIRTQSAIHKKTRVERAFLWMARWGGFEPPTPWFVAKYSIQLSYRSAEAGHILLGLSESNT